MVKEDCNPVEQNDHYRCVSSVRLCYRPSFSIPVSSRPKITIFSLPPELLQLVAGELPIESAVSFSLASKHLRRTLPRLDESLSSDRRSKVRLLDYLLQDLQRDYMLCVRCMKLYEIRSETARWIVRCPHVKMTWERPQRDLMPACKNLASSKQLSFRLLALRHGLLFQERQVFREWAAQMEVQMVEFEKHSYRSKPFFPPRAKSSTKRDMRRGM